MLKMDGVIVLSEVVHFAKGKREWSQKRPSQLFSGRPHNSLSYHMNGKVGWA
jgi:hypothetical protein